MRKTIILSVILFTLVANMDAQRYSINKLKYDSYQYIPELGDPYNPAISGLCSFFVPGLGQMLSGEVGRGLGFLGGYVGCYAICGVGYYQFLNSASGYSGYSGNPVTGFGTMFLGFGGMVAVSIWSIVDAVNVAKVNNMYIRDLRKTSSVNFEVEPFIETLTINNQIVKPVGLTMRVTF